MALLRIAEAARVCRVARSTLQRAIQAGRLSCTPDHRLDTAELLRAGYVLAADSAPPRQAPAAGTTRQVEQRTRQPAAGTTRQVEQLQQALAQLQDTLALVQRENAVLRQLWEQASAREAWYQHQVDQAQAQAQRLLPPPAVDGRTPAQWQRENAQLRQALRRRPR